MERGAGIDSLVRELSVLGGSSAWPRACEAAIRRIDEPLQRVAEHFLIRSATERQALFDGSHETGTHFKWLLYRHRAPRFALWLHEYKPPATRGPGYAEVPHDHRYGIVSLVLCGGYTAVAWSKTGGTVVPVDHTVFRPGDVMMLRHDEVHSLTDIRPGTLTLVVEGDRAKGHSTAYDTSAGCSTTFPDFTERWSALRLKLRRP